MVRNILLQNDVDKEIIGDAIAAIIAINQEDDELSRRKQNYMRHPIHLYINSFGGSVHDMWSLISVIEASATPVYTYCTGYAMSAGFMIFIAGHRRFIGKYAQLMYHQLSTGVIGTAQEIAECFESTEKEYAKMEEYVLLHTKIPRKRLQEIRKRKQDWYISPKEALTLGIADEVIRHV